MYKIIDLFICDNKSKNTIKVVCVCLILLLSLNFSIICAAPSDHGREYYNNGWGLDDLIGLVLLVVVIIMGIAIFLYGFLNDKSKQGVNHSANNSANNRTSGIKGSTGYIPIHLRFETCTKCNGRGWNKGEQFFGHNCFTCGGSGHIPSSKALSLLKEYKERKKLRSDEDRRFTMYKAMLIYNEYKKELENCPPCPDCRELQNIKDSDIYTDYDGRQYIKVTCDRCKGTGRVNYY